MARRDVLQTADDAPTFSRLQRKPEDKPMRAAFIAFSASFAAMAAAPSAQAAPVAPVPGLAVHEGVATPIGWRSRKSYSDHCRPYNGPYGYYGNPYCEGGFSRYGDAGGYEIDLTHYFERRYWRERRHRRWR